MIDQYSRNLCDTFGKCEYETIARNLLILSQRAGGWLVGFTADYYAEHCDHETKNEVRWLNTLAEAGFLDKEGNTYSINALFISRMRLLKPGESNR